MFTKDGVSLPMVTIMIEGGMQSIDQAVSTLRKGWSAWSLIETQFSIFIFYGQTKPKSNEFSIHTDFLRNWFLALVNTA